MNKSTIKKYIKVGKVLIFNSFSVVITSRVDFVAYFIGKLVRMGFLLWFLDALFGHIDSLVGYTREEVIFFYATFNLLDILAQMVFFRSLWFLQPAVKKGEIDYWLLKPLNILFYASCRIIDWIDITTLVPSLALLFWSIGNLKISLNFLNVSLYLILCFNGLLLSYGVNLIFASLMFFTTEVGEGWLIYRDLMNVVRFPPEVFGKGLRFFLSTILPVIVIVSFPVKSLLGLLSWKACFYAPLITGVFLLISVKFWNFVLKNYTSASS